PTLPLHDALPICNATVTFPSHTGSWALPGSRPRTPPFYAFVSLFLRTSRQVSTCSSYFAHRTVEPMATPVVPPAQRPGVSGSEGSPEPRTERSRPQVSAPTLSCVLLTMGTRPAEPRRAIASVPEQDDADVEVVVVSNGADLPELPEGIKTVLLPETVGIPAGRNHGVRAC